MRTFAHHVAVDPAEAVTLVADDPSARFLAGGSNLVDHLKLGVVEPGLLVDISRLALDGIEETSEGGLRVGATVRNSDLAAHPVVRRDFPVVAEALLAGASPQIRHQATTGGNLLQRTRCVYFQDVTTPCNKREPGSGCAALEGYARHNAVLGASAACVTTHPSDLAVALAAVDAQVVVLGPDGERRVPMTQLHRLPGDRPADDTVLTHGELITAVELPGDRSAPRSAYVKVRDRASYAFALVSVAACLEVADDTVAEVRIAWGGVAHRPWRATRAEAALRGTRVDELDEDAVRAAADLELEAAETDDRTAFKVPMVRNTTALVLGRLIGEVAR